MVRIVWNSGVWNIWALLNWNLGNLGTKWKANPQKISRFYTVDILYFPTTCFLIGSIGSSKNLIIVEVKKKNNFTFPRPFIA